MGRLDRRNWRLLEGWRAERRVGWQQWLVQLEHLLVLFFRFRSRFIAWCARSCCSGRSWSSQPTISWAGCAGTSARKSCVSRRPDPHAFVSEARNKGLAGAQMLAGFARCGTAVQHPSRCRGQKVVFSRLKEAAKAVGIDVWEEMGMWKRHSKISKQRWKNLSRTHRLTSWGFFAIGNMSFQQK